MAVIKFKPILSHKVNSGIPQFLILGQSQNQETVRVLSDKKVSLTYEPIKIRENTETISMAVQH